MSLSKLIEREFGVKTGSRENPLVSSVGTSASQVLPNNPNRLGWVIVNLSANTIYLAFTPDVSNSKGIILSPGGGIASMIYREDFELVARGVYAIASGASSAVYALEVVIEGEV